MKLTGEQVKQAMLRAGIDYVEHHDCSGCGYMTNFHVRDGQLYFDAGCYCSRYGTAMLEPRDWQDAADWINMQTNPEIAAELAAKFGIAISLPSDQGFISLAEFRAKHGLGRTR